MIEKWKEIKGFEDLYEVSNTEKVRSMEHKITIVQKNRTFVKTIPQKELYIHIDKKGYKSVSLSKNGIDKHYWLHRLVAIAFPEICGEWFDGAEVNHKDENPQNCRPENLEVCTKSHNCSYGNRNKKRIEKIGKKVLCMKDGKVVKTYPSVADANRDFGKTKGAGNIHMVLKGVTKHAYGYEWKLAE